MGCYIALDYSLTIEIIVLAINQHPHSTELPVAKYFNSDLSGSEGYMRDKNITVELVIAVLKDMSENFSTL